MAERPMPDVFDSDNLEFLEEEQKLLSVTPESSMEDVSSKSKIAGSNVVTKKNSWQEGELSKRGTKDKKKRNRFYPS